jgi:uncharacterized protein
VPDATVVHVSDAPQVTDNHAGSRFELQVGGHPAELRYRRNGNRLVLIHTGVPVELEGRGIGGRLVAAALDRAAQEGLTVVPVCPGLAEAPPRRREPGDHRLGQGPGCIRGRWPG